MKIVLQKVSQASVVVDSKVISSIKHGYMLLVGISIDDSMAEIDKLSKKVLSLRIFEDESRNLWKKNIKEANGEILSVSQFTLMAKTKKGTKPDFHLAQKGHIAKELYEEFLKLLRSDLGEEKVKDGEFGAMMSCSLTNEGPVTIILDSDQ
ncbi:ADI_G0007710.mRNA.1.CDS.1 [Saccharomyces cerevisiae]|uniref:D-aminoacyl-tRNA deacylase n=6 Tax=Saccharomyces cerevisiae TaxID=4932 RepID=DTD_YEAST|nr:D-tyrosyl-tRNA(Tyr) deacylase [Saccharomyces cerevisiae S288C]Q07648.1 RecName: Full=D-aminoacyl-tRNA deacylase; Short=DTD; AltName: Full=D-tyrosyl-tRNA(Tyr) deacylase; AltName: Full=Gly-tRNA(Ala) deacylase [Saccharomyces cerevisiae S288C]AHY74798.1 Dtd1p [Saccharomyces cerevisiae YJM993]AJP37539.1 Dtd1p [Saccharomyces cerevisiae YJM1078]AJU57651.1 Dtd1p [Saccharomyces cerevisiae YJM189]AJU58354.1 Dtd1p [Saccharomyces cerevisiae YJM193]AJU59043.1 Dtd1p [Saccharomyces cerevisiae YJM195]AJU|eukprot:NP_010062.1 D-tyrosyl-tRNA(Tyr) deacylase [Saccharomyces cerevisiae S288C]